MKECNHIWEIIEEQLILDKSLFKSRVYFYKMRVLKCKKCGDLKNHRTYLGEDFYLRKDLEEMK